MESGRPHGKPVFVDDSGRRCGIVRSIGRLLVAVTVVIVALSAIALSVSPTVANATPPTHAVSSATVMNGSVAHDP